MRHDFDLANYDLDFDSDYESYNTSDEEARSVFFYFQFVCIQKKANHSQENFPQDCFLLFRATKPFRK